MILMATINHWILGLRYLCTIPSQLFFEYDVFTHLDLYFYDTKYTSEFNCCYWSLNSRYEILMFYLFTIIFWIWFCTFKLIFLKIYYKKYLSDYYNGYCRFVIFMYYPCTIIFWIWCFYTFKLMFLRYII